MVQDEMKSERERWLLKRFRFWPSYSKVPDIQMSKKRSPREKGSKPILFLISPFLQSTLVERSLFYRRRQTDRQISGVQLECLVDLKR